MLLWVAGAVGTAARGPAFADVRCRTIKRVVFASAEAGVVKIKSSVYPVVCVSNIARLGIYAADLEAVRRLRLGECLGNRLTGTAYI